MINIEEFISSVVKRTTDELYGTSDNIQIQKTRKEFEKTFAYYQNDGTGSYQYWYKQDDLSKTYEYTSLDFKWTKADETVVDWKPYSVEYYRLKQTVFNLEYYGEDGILGNNYFEAHNEDTPMELEYKSYSFGKEQSDYNW